MHAEIRADAWPLTCPVCNASLSRGAGTLSCPSGHSFDIAREGYANLLASQHRARGIEGDTAEMLHSRRRFLESGHYSPLLEALTTHVADVIENQAVAGVDEPRRGCVLEVGCGEGYYVGGIADALRETAAPDTVWAGADLSKPAVKMAAKAHASIAFFVADINRRIYVESGSVRALLDVFAPRNPAEFARVIAPGGCAVVAIPGSSHLASLRDALGLIGIQEDKERLVLERFEDEFELAARTEVAYAMELSAEALSDLVGMGPSSRHRAGREALPAETTMTEASFVILRLRRK